MAFDSEKRLLKQLLDLIDTPNLCNIVRSVYHGGGVKANNREEAEMMLLTQSYTEVLSSRRIPIDFILKFLIAKGLKWSGGPNVSRSYLCLAFKSLIENQPDYIQPPAQNLQPIQPVSNNMLALSQNNNMMRCQPFDSSVSQISMPSESIKVNAKSKKDRNNELLEEFIEMFAQHFYNLFNNLGMTGKDQLDGRHFYENCTMAMRILGGNEEVMENCNDSSSTLQCLLGVKKEHQLFFSPNLGDGVKWKKESHGLVKIHIGGTLHQGVGRMVGMFEQQFILREDPQAANTWKILNTNLMMKNMDSLTAGSTLSIQESQTNHLQIDSV